MIPPKEDRLSGPEMEQEYRERRHRIGPSVDAEIARFEASLSPEQLKVLEDMADKAFLEGYGGSIEPRGLRSLIE